jgi:TatD DNase family protein
MRGKKNEPSYIKYTVKKLAEIKKIDTIEMISITNDNFEKLFLN